MMRIMKPPSLQYQTNFTDLQTIDCNSIKSVLSPQPISCQCPTSILPENVRKPKPSGSIEMGHWCKMD